VGQLMKAGQVIMNQAGDHMTALTRTSSSKCLDLLHWLPQLVLIKAINETLLLMKAPAAQTKEGCHFCVAAYQSWGSGSLLFP
jgi:hypothetical protein